MSDAFQPGQRWHSMTEPELGLGLVERVEDRQVVISYPAREVVRRYAIDDAPLARARLSVGQLARSHDGASFRIEDITDASGLLTYHGEGQQLEEIALDPEVDVATPENRLRTGQVDEFRQFDLRFDALETRHAMLASPARGFLGGRIELFAHQLSIARDVCERHRVRVLLADEVGLGKTIEALLILHRLLLSGRIERALVLVPPALVHQWLAEAYLRFNLILRVIGDETLGGGTIDLASEDLPSDLLCAQLFVCPLGVEVSESLADTPWDLVIVDEAHHLQPDSDDFLLVKKLAERVDHVILLSATPDRDGETAHFERLALLDPNRFSDEKAYREESAHYRELADTAERLQAGDPLLEEDARRIAARLASDDLDSLLAKSASDRGARQELLSRLLDLHGIGRVMFRNVRARIPGFPRRSRKPVALGRGNPERLRREFLHDIGRDEDFKFTGAADDPRTSWLAEFLANHPDEKVLVLCSTRAKVDAFAKALSTPKFDVARFHEKMSTIERDRQAAWFLGDDGPQILISSAIGAEGRNFQVARNLVLLDLPLTADRLEQLIGRVDRIGQGDEIHVHALVADGTPQAWLARWHDEALRVFDRPWHGSPVIDRELGEALLQALLSEDEAPIDALIDRGRERNEQILGELENGRDRLLELTSFDREAAAELTEIIASAEESSDLEEFLVNAFERGGLDVEWIGDRSYVVRVGLDYHRPFPGFREPEMAVTFDRAIGVTHPERTLVTWDHPLARDTVDTLLAGDHGNASIARLPGDGPSILLEALYVAEPTVPRALRADRFFPPTPIRVVVDPSGREVTLDARARRSMEAFDSGFLQHPQVAELLPRLLESTRTIAEANGPALADDARGTMRKELEPVVTRLGELAVRNPSVAATELEAARSELAALDEGLRQVRIRLDGLRLIVLS